MPPSPISESDFSNLDTQTVNLLKRLKRLNGEIFSNKEEDSSEDRTTDSVGHRNLERNTSGLTNSDASGGGTKSSHSGGNIRKLSNSMDKTSPPTPHPEPERPPVGNTQQQHRQLTLDDRSSSDDDDSVLVIDSTAENDSPQMAPSTNLSRSLNIDDAKSPQNSSPLVKNHSRSSLSPTSPSNVNITTSDVSPASVERLNNYHQMKNLFSGKMKSPPKELVALHREALYRIEQLQQEIQQSHNNLDEMETQLLNANDAHIRETRRLNQSIQEYRDTLQLKEKHFEDREQQLLDENYQRDERIRELEAKMLQLQQRLTKQASSDSSGRISDTVLREKDNIIGSLNEQVEELSEALYNARNEKRQVDTALNRSDATLKTLKSKVDSLTDENDTLHQKNDKMRDELDRTRAEAHERTQYHDNSMQRIRKKLESQGNTIRTHEETIQNLTTELQSTQVSLAEVDHDNKEIDRLRQDYEQVSRDFHDYKHQVEERELANDTVEKTLSYSRDMLKEKDFDISDLKAQIQELKRDKSRVELQFTEYRERNEQLQSETLTIHTKIQHMKNNYLQMVVQRDSLQEKLDQLAGGTGSPRMLSNAAKEERIESLEKMLEETTSKLSTTKRDLAELQLDYAQLETKYKNSHTLQVEMSSERTKSDEYKSTLMRYQDQYESLYVQYAELESKHVELEREFEVYKQNEHSAAEYGEELTRQNEVLQRELVELRSQKQSEIGEQMKREQLDNARLDTVHERLNQLTQALSQAQLEKQDMQTKNTTLEIEKQVRLEREQKREKEAASQVEYLNHRVKELKHHLDLLREEHSKALRQLNDDKLQLENDIRHLRSNSQAERRSLLEKEIKSSKSQMNALRVKYESEVSNLRRRLSENATLIESLKHEITALNRSRHEELADMRIQMRLLESSNRYQDMYKELNAEAERHKKDLSSTSKHTPVKGRRKFLSPPNIFLSNGTSRSHISTITTPKRHNSTASAFGRVGSSWRDKELNQTF